MAVRRSARTAKPASVAEQTSEPIEPTAARSSRAKSSQTNALSRKGVPQTKKAVSAGKATATKRARQPLSSHQTAKNEANQDDSGANLSGDSHPSASGAAPRPNNASALPAPLKDFIDDPDVTLDPESEIDHKTMELVTSWKARTEVSPPHGKIPQPLPFSSSLPPSSPLPPLPTRRASAAGSVLSLSEFNPPSPQQEAQFLQGQGPDLDAEDEVDAVDDIRDVSYDSVMSDEFGFFAAQRKIHAKRDRAQNLKGVGIRNQGRISDETVGLEETSFETDAPSFSGRPAFATPHVRRRSRPATPAAEEEESPSKLVESLVQDTQSPTSSPQQRPKRSRSRTRVREVSGQTDDDEEPVQRAKATRGRPKKTSIPPVKPLSRSAKSRKASGSSTGTTKEKPKAKPRKAKKTIASSVADEEEIDLDDAIESGEDVDEVDSRELTAKAKKQRIAEFRALDDYELEVEDVIVF